MSDIWMPGRTTQQGWDGITSEIEKHAKELSLISGIVLRLNSSTDVNVGDDAVRSAPITLFPSPFPKDHFNRAVDLQTTINDMFNRIAHDDQFLEESLQPVCNVDDFTSQLLQIHQTCLKDGYSQEVSLGLLRSDYMIDLTDGSNLSDASAMKQVEVNTISAGFGGLGPKVGKLHENVLLKCGQSKEAVRERLPDNTSTEKMTAMMLEAWNLYSRTQSAILFLVEPRTVNIGDQKTFEAALNMQRPDVKVMRRNFDQLLLESSLDSDNRLIVGGTEIAVVYFRYGYSPDHYPGDRYWKLRLMIEKSRSIKCPSVRYHLSGAKKIQQLLANPTTLERFVSDPREVNRLLSVTAGMYGLEMNQEGDATVEMALKNPEKYVLKPQREGGGNNYYKEQIPVILTPVKDSPERAQYILMELIQQQVIDNYILISGRSHEERAPPEKVVCELGIFGGILAGRKWTLSNQQTGHVLRSKTLGTLEGGIAAGFGAIDSPYLY